MKTKHTAFHWPDHVIGKRESRQIKEAHNALYNDFHDLLEALRDLLAYANDYSDTMAKSGRGAEQLGKLADSVSVAGMARAAIAKATKIE